MTILPLAYLPSVEYFAHLLRGGCVVDLGEHFVKRSERNRARILATDGVMELTVHVCHANRPRQPVRDVRIDYSKRWQHQHWMSILSAYRNSPYFDHYRDRFEPFYNREFTFLADWNIALLETVTGILGTPPALRFSDSYIEADTDDRDLRPAFEPRKAFGNAVFDRLVVAQLEVQEGERLGRPPIAPVEGAIVAEEIRRRDRAVVTQCE